MQTRLGVTTLYVTHDQVEAMTMGDRVAVLKRGELQQVDAPQTLYDRPDNLFVAGFIGSPSMNIGEGQLTRDNGTTYVHLGEDRIKVPDGAFEKHTRLRDYGERKVIVGLRPEHFVRGADYPEDQRVEVGVELVEALGSDVLIHFRTGASPVVTEDMRQAVDDPDAFAEMERQARAGGQTFTARLEPRDMPRVGDRIPLGFRGEEMHFFDYDSGKSLR